MSLRRRELMGNLENGDVLWLYKDGYECTDITGGVQFLQKVSSRTQRNDYFTISNSTGTTLPGGIAFGNVKPIRAGKYNFVNLEIKHIIDSSSTHYLKVVTFDRGDDVSSGRIELYHNNSGIGVRQVVKVDLQKSFDENRCLYICIIHSGLYIYNVWLSKE